MAGILSLHDVGVTFILVYGHRQVVARHLGNRNERMSTLCGVRNYICIVQRLHKELSTPTFYKAGEVSATCAFTTQTEVQRASTGTATENAC